MSDLPASEEARIRLLAKDIELHRRIEECLAKYTFTFPVETGDIDHVRADLQKTIAYSPDNLIASARMWSDDRVIVKVLDNLDSVIFHKTMHVQGTP